MVYVSTFKAMLASTSPPSWSTIMGNPIHWDYSVDTGFFLTLYFSEKNKAEAEVFRQNFPLTLLAPSLVPLLPQKMLMALLILGTFHGGVRLYAFSNSYCSSWMYRGRQRYIIRGEIEFMTACAKSFSEQPLNDTYITLSYSPFLPNFDWNHKFSMQD